MRKALTAIVVAVVILIVLSLVQAHAADSRLPVTKKPNAATPQLNVFPPATGGPKVANPQTGVNTGTPPKTTARIQCGFNDSTHRGECSCTGDIECNDMFTNYCKEGGASSCDNGTGKCTCEMKL
jgi:hypothetical protein